MPISLSQSQVGRGWRELALNEPLTTLTQSYVISRDKWVDACFLTRDGHKNLGRMNYRAPVSLWAGLVASITCLPKLWRRYVLKKPY
mgnify:CR=1 FL=1